MEGGPMTLKDPDVVVVPFFIDTQKKSFVTLHSVLKVHYEIRTGFPTTSYHTV
jgi:hypothetical protein